MASTIDGIITQLLTDLETTSIEKAFDGYISKCTSYPYAMLVLDNAAQDFTLTSTHDDYYSMRVGIIGKNAEDVRNVLEELGILWLDATKLAVLRALDVMAILPEGFAGPEESADKQNTVYQGIYDFLLRVRMSNT